MKGGMIKLHIVTTQEVLREYAREKIIVKVSALEIGQQGIVSVE